MMELKGILSLHFTLFTYLHFFIFFMNNVVVHIKETNFFKLENVILIN